MDDQETGEEIQVVTKVSLVAAGSDILVESVKIKLPPGTEVTPQLGRRIPVRDFRGITAVDH